MKFERGQFLQSALLIHVPVDVTEACEGKVKGVVKALASSSQALEFHLSLATEPVVTEKSNPLLLDTGKVFCSGYHCLPFQVYSGSHLLTNPNREDEEQRE